MRLFRMITKGALPVKNAYHLGVKSNRVLLPLRLTGKILQRIRRRYGVLNIHSNMKHTSWRTLSNLVPTLHSLLSKGIHSNSLCLFCRSHRESTSHIMLECRLSKKIWSSFLPSNALSFNVGKGLLGPSELMEIFRLDSPHILCACVHGSGAIISFSRMEFPPSKISRASWSKA